MGAQIMTSHAATVGESSRTAVRYALAAVTALLGVAYALIALKVVHVADVTVGETVPYVMMGAAAAAFFLGSVLLVLSDRRIVYLLGAAVQVVVLAGYFAVSPSRDPHFEAWGLTMKVVQVVVLGVLLYLALKAPAASREGREPAA